MDDQKTSEKLTKQICQRRKNYLPKIINSPYNSISSSASISGGGGDIGGGGGDGGGDTNTSGEGARMMRA